MFTRQFFHLLSGRAVIEVDGRLHGLDAEQGLEIAPGQVHQFRNVE
ncbi:MAG: mannose-6-phosphate isomerase-like protein (cupin superfamily) [Gammaproteobacteria bacterium]|jgi:mannose-6-phosphate isomerase-like protein (cupin superfamily)